MNRIEICINGHPPFGVVLEGGLEHGSEITVFEVKRDSLAEKAGLLPNDIICSINGISVKKMTKVKAGKLIANSVDGIYFLVKRKKDEAGMQNHLQRSKTHFAPTQRMIKNETSKDVKVLEKNKVQGTNSLTDENAPLNNQLIEASAKKRISEKKCTFCENLIKKSDIHINIGDDSWHIYHFNCENCGKTLLREGFKQEGIIFLCENCFDDYNCKKCGICKKVCIDQFIATNGTSYHVKCFKCQNCKKKLSCKMFMPLRDSIYCIKCFAQVYSIDCEFCDQPIKPDHEFIEVLSKSYHTHCFRCPLCKKDLSKSPSFQILNDQPCCSNH